MRKKLILTWQYHSLGMFLIVGAAILILTKYQNHPKIQFAVLAYLSIVYLVWALLHHLFDKSLTAEVVLEYALTVVLAIVVFYGLFF